MAAEGRLRSHARLLFRMARLNLQGAMEYRVSFLMSVVFMAMNNFIWLAFWWVFFQRFEQVEGWQLPDVVLLFAVSATGFGISHVLFGNLNRLSLLVAEGQIDVALSQPKDPLLKLLAGRMSVPAIGDLFFGLGVFFLIGEPRDFPLFLLLVVLAATVFTAFAISAHALAFWTGQSEGVSRTMVESLLMFSMYPDALFSGGVRFLLYTVVPAGLFSYLPVQLLRGFDAALLFGYVVLSVSMLVAAWALFSAGLRRYESGNQMVSNV